MAATKPEIISRVARGVSDKFQRLFSCSRIWPVQWHEILMSAMSPFTGNTNLAMRYGNRHSYSSCFGTSTAEKFRRLCQSFSGPPVHWRQPDMCVGMLHNTIITTSSFGDYIHFSCIKTGDSQALLAFDLVNTDTTFTLCQGNHSVARQCVTLL